jgi:Tfp pilus assembly protein PilP
MSHVRWITSFVVVSVLAISGAFYLTSALMSRGHAQDNQAPAEAPANVPENMQPPTETDTAPAPAVPDTTQLPSPVTTAPVQMTAETGDTGDIDTNIRDPFKPYRDFKTEPGKSVSRDPLQNLDLNTVTVVAVLWDVSRPRALIKSGENLFTVLKGQKLGRNGGDVVAIREGEVVVAETYEEEGKLFRQFVTLKLPTVDAKKAVGQ